MRVAAASIALMLLLAAAPATSAPANASKAIEAISKEFDQSRAGKGELRGKANFFGDHGPAPAADVIITALNRPIPGDAVKTSYVKWQLTSGLPEKVEGKLAGGVLSAYQNAPHFIQRPGLEQSERQRLDELAQSATREKAADFQQELTAAADKVAKLNEPALAYRAALYGRVNVSYDLLTLGYADAHERAAAGIDPKPLLKQLATDIHNWTTLEATPQQISSMARLLTELSQEPAVEYYDAVEWSTTGGTAKLKWKTKRLRLNDRKQLDELITFLNQQSRDAAALKSKK